MSVRRTAAPEEAGRVSESSSAAAEPGLRAPNPPLTDSVSINLISQRCCKANKRHPLMPCGCQRGSEPEEGARSDRERERERVGEAAQEAGGRQRRPVQ